MSDFYQSHLPCCVSHLSKDEALSRGREISLFLRDAVESMSQNGAHDTKNAYGMFLCFELMTDYLDIAMGEYAPFLEVIQKEELFQPTEKKAVRHD